jgi:branched-chain amino acid transport system ATP-binding protein
MTRPRLLVLDEPSIGLAPKVVAEIFEVLSALTREGLSLLLVEQNVQLSLRSVDEAYVLRQGEIVLRGAAAELLEDPQVRAAYLGQ